MFDGKEGLWDLGADGNRLGELKNGGLRKNGMYGHGVGGRR
jgi:hypothetical protein